MNVLQRWLHTRSLRSADMDARCRGLEKLVQKRDNHSFQLLTEALTDRTALVRAVAAVALRFRGQLQAVEPLVQHLVHEPELIVQEAIVEALAELDHDRTVNMLLQLLEDDSLGVRQTAAWALERIAWDSLDDARRARVAMVRAKWELIPPFGDAAVEMLDHALRTGTQRVQTEAASALAEIGTKSALSALFAAVDDFELPPFAREVAARSLRRYHEDELTTAQHAAISVALDEWTVIGELGGAAVPALVRALKNGTDEIRRYAVRALVRMLGDAITQVIAETVCTPQLEPAIRQECIAALCQRGAANHVGCLVAALSDETWPVRVTAADALAALQWQPMQDQERLRFCLAKQDWEELVPAGPAAVTVLLEGVSFAAINGAAARALARIRPEGIDALAALLGDRDCPSALRELAAATLVELGDPRAVIPLTEMLRDADIMLQQVAVWALERLGWSPRDDRERAIVAIVHGDWDNVSRCGGAAVEPLLQFIDAGVLPFECRAALRAIMEKSPARLTIAQLRKIAALADHEVRLDLWGRREADRHAGDTQVDMSNVRKLARFELLRRGILA